MAVVNTHGSNGGAPGSGPHPGQSLLAHVGPLLSHAQGGLDLAVLGQVEGGDLLGRKRRAGEQLTSKGKKPKLPGIQKLNPAG